MASMSATIAPPFFTETEIPATPVAPAPVRGRRPRRLCIDAHTEFVATLVAELQASVARLQSASRRLVDGDDDADDAAGAAGLDREARDIARLVELLDAIDGPASRRHLAPVSLPQAVVTAARESGVAVEVSGGAGDEHFVADGACVRTALELLLLALSGDGTLGPVRVENTGGRKVTLEGTMDLGDPRRTWQLRSGRRVADGEGIHVRLLEAGVRYRVELSIGR